MKELRISARSISSALSDGAAFSPRLIRPLCVPTEPDSFFEDEISARYSGRVYSLWKRLDLVFLAENAAPSEGGRPAVNIRNFYSQFLLQFFQNRNIDRLIRADQPGSDFRAYHFLSGRREFINKISRNAARHFADKAVFTNEMTAFLEMYAAKKYNLVSRKTLDLAVNKIVNGIRADRYDERIYPVLQSISECYSSAAPGSAEITRLITELTSAPGKNARLLERAAALTGARSAAPADNIRKYAVESAVEVLYRDELKTVKSIVNSSSKSRNGLTRVKAEIRKISVEKFNDFVKRSGFKGGGFSQGDALAARAIALIEKLQDGGLEERGAEKTKAKKAKKDNSDIEERVSIFFAEKSGYEIRRLLREVVREHGISEETVFSERNIYDNSVIEAAAGAVSLLTNARKAYSAAVSAEKTAENAAENVPEDRPEIPAAELYAYIRNALTGNVRRGGDDLLPGISETFFRENTAEKITGSGIFSGEMSAYPGGTELFFTEERPGGAVSEHKNVSEILPQNSPAANVYRQEKAGGKPGRIARQKTSGTAVRGSLAPLPAHGFIGAGAFPGLRAGGVRAGTFRIPQTGGYPGGSVRNYSALYRENFYRDLTQGSAGNNVSLTENYFEDHGSFENYYYELDFAGSGRIAAGAVLPPAAEPRALTIENGVYFSSAVPERTLLTREIREIRQPREEFSAGKAAPSAPAALTFREGGESLSARGEGGVQRADGNVRGGTVPGVSREVREKLDEKTLSVLNELVSQARAERPEGRVKAVSAENYTAVRTENITANNQENYTANSYENYLSRTGNYTANSYENYATRIEKYTANRYENYLSRTGNHTANRYENYLSRTGNYTANRYENYLSRTGNYTTNRYENYLSRTGNYTANRYENYLSRTGNYTANRYENYVSHTGNYTANRYENYAAARNAGYAGSPFFYAESAVPAEGLAGMLSAYGCRLSVNTIKTVLLSLRSSALESRRFSPAGNGYFSEKIRSLSAGGGEAAQGAVQDPAQSTALPRNVRYITGGADMVMLIPPVQADRFAARDRQLPPIDLKQQPEPKPAKEEKPKTLNEKISSRSTIRTETPRGLENLSYSEISRLADKVYAQIEQRLTRERARMGL